MRIVIGWDWPGYLQSDLLVWSSRARTLTLPVLLAGSSGPSPCDRGSRSRAHGRCPGKSKRIGVHETDESGELGSVRHTRLGTRHDTHAPYRVFIIIRNAEQTPLIVFEMFCVHKPSSYYIHFWYKRQRTTPL